MREKYPISFYGSVIVFSFAILSVGTFIERYQSLILFLAFSLSFLAYAFVCQERKSFHFLLILGVSLRLILFISMPSLSDDVYRFMWDGTLLKNEIHPFEHLPGFYLDKELNGINKELFNHLNSKEHFTIYPPVNQLIFWISSVVGNSNWLLATNVIRVMLLLADLGAFWFLSKLLDRYKMPRYLAFLYFLNPLVILEFVGNLHFEGIVIGFLLGGMYWFEKSKKLLSAISFGLAIGTKLLPYIYLPYLFIAGLKEKKWTISVLAGIVSVATFLPLLNEHFINGMQSSVNLYFRKFEFNASVYFLIREIGFWITGFNQIAKIGPVLSILSLLAILFISLLGASKKWTLPKTMLFILTSYLLFSTTVHPWYILPLIILGILSGYYFPVVWSFMIFLTYLGYSETSFQLPSYVVVIEYATVLVAFFIERKKIISNPT